MIPLFCKWSRLYSNVVASTTNTLSANYTHYKKFSLRSLGGKLDITSEKQKQTLGKSIRPLSTLESPRRNINSPPMMSKEEITEYMAVLPEVVRELTLLAEKYKSKEAAIWFRKALQYNLSVTSAKNSLITVLTYKSLVSSDQLTAQKLKLAHLLAWCVELHHCIILMSDDMVDGSLTRRGQPCWHKLKEVGLNAINDVLMIENSLYELLKNHFRHLDCYLELIELFRWSTFVCMTGQTLDLLVSKKNVSNYNMSTYNSIALHKTSKHFFYLPVALGLHLAGIKDQRVFDECKAITFDLGTYCQTQNDFNDCFSNANITGKIGTDIQEHKCTWLAVMCMEYASPEQRAVMEECYGKHDPQKMARVKQVYEDLNLPSIFAKYEKETYKSIKRRIQQTSHAVPQKVLLEILNTIYQIEVK